jgi:hypothetical protein
MRRRPNKGGRVVIPQPGGEEFHVIDAGPGIDLLPVPERETVVTTLTAATPAGNVKRPPGSTGRA